MWKFMFLLHKTYSFPSFSSYRLHKYIPLHPLVAVPLYMRYGTQDPLETNDKQFWDGTWNLLCPPPPFPPSTPSGEYILLHSFVALSYIVVYVEHKILLNLVTAVPGWTWKLVYPLLLLFLQSHPLGGYTVTTSLLGSWVLGYVVHRIPLRLVTALLVWTWNLSCLSLPLTPPTGDTYHFIPW